MFARMRRPVVAAAGTAGLARKATVPRTLSGAALHDNPRARTGNVPSVPFANVSLYSPARTPSDAVPNPRVARPAPLQAKLEVGAVDDPLEKEADRLADRVMRIPDSAVPTGAELSAIGPWKLHRLRQRCNDEGTARGEARETSIGGMAAPPLVQEALRSPGRPLDNRVRDFMEPRFGRDFSGVRVHDGDLASQSAESVGASAYTAGLDIVFAAHRYSPGTERGQRLLAHELAHVIQQKGRAPRIARQTAVHPASEALEVSSLSVSQKLWQAILHSGRWVGPELLARITAALSPQELGAMALVLVGGAIVQSIPVVGQVADGALVAWALYSLGSEAIHVVGEFVSFARKAVFADSEADLDEAGHHFANFVSAVGVDLAIAVLLHRASRAVSRRINTTNEPGGSGGGQVLAVEAGPSVQALDAAEYRVLADGTIIRLTAGATGTAIHGFPAPGAAQPASPGFASMMLRTPSGGFTASAGRLGGTSVSYGDPRGKHTQVGDFSQDELRDALRSRRGLRGRLAEFVRRIRGDINYGGQLNRAAVAEYENLVRSAIERGVQRGNGYEYEAEFEIGYDAITGRPTRRYRVLGAPHSAHIVPMEP
jgi:hypothetical protein